MLFLKKPKRYSWDYASNLSHLEIPVNSQRKTQAETLSNGSGSPSQQGQGHGGKHSKPPPAWRAGLFFFFFPFKDSASSSPFCTLVFLFRDYYIWSSLFSHVAFHVSNNIKYWSAKLSGSLTPKYGRWCFTKKSPPWRKKTAVNGAAKRTRKFTSFWKCKLRAGFESVYLLQLLFP